MWASEPSKWKQIKHNKVLRLLMLLLLLDRQVSYSLFNLCACMWVPLCVCVCPPMSAVPTLCSPCLLAIMILMVRPPVESPFVSHSLACSPSSSLSAPPSVRVCCVAIKSDKTLLIALSICHTVTHHSRVKSPLNASLFQFTFNIYAHFSNTPTHAHTHTHSDKLSHTHWEAAVIYACA